MDQQTYMIISTAWAVLAVVGRWLLFRKAGKPGWHSIIPILNAYDEYDICWKGRKIFLVVLLAAIAGGCASQAQENPFLAAVGAMAALWVLIIHWRQSMKLARSFGKGGLTGFFLFLFNNIGRVILGLSAAEYVGKE
ncbi:MAG: DUF5684 domain-containing protein [Oscillospiraceae bacterium]|nr:DUF5684 domain-containing protein [Oscillospiraceae bacterium]